VDDVLLHVHVKQQRRSRHPILLAAKAQIREAMWCAGRDSLLGVRRPPDVRVRESVELPMTSLYTLFVWSWAYEVCIQTKCEP
jgi:hypothetical protein